MIIKFLGALCKSLEGPKEDWSCSRCPLKHRQTLESNCGLNFNISFVSDKKYLTYYDLVKIKSLLENPYYLVATPLFDCEGRDDTKFLRAATLYINSHRTLKRANVAEQVYLESHDLL